MVTFEVVHSQWAAEDEVFAAGEHEVAKPSAAFLRLLAGAEAAGSVIVLDTTPAHRAKLDSHVQSQEDAEKAYAAAQADGSWQEGNLADFIAIRENRLAFDDWLQTAPKDELVAYVAERLNTGAGIEGITDFRLSDADRALNERELADARARLAELTGESE